MGLAVLAILLLVAGGIALVARRWGPPRPDIVVIVWDTCRADRVSLDGCPLPTAPRLEELAKRGVNFRRCLSPIPWTPPAHASLFTGLLPRNNGLGRREGDRVHKGIPLLAETLGEAGYETVLLTSNPYLSDVTGLNAGFGTVLSTIRGEDPFQNSTEARDAIRGWLAARPPRRAGDRPLFLFINLMDTHLPYAFDGPSVAAVHGDGSVNAARSATRTVGPEQARSYNFEDYEIPEGILQDLRNTYDGAVRLMDRNTDEILDDVRRAGFLEGAFIAVCADHGESLGEHRILGHAMTIYQPVLRVPMLVIWPGRLEGGRVEDAQVRLQDLYPTILEAARVPVPAPCGKDALSLGETPLRPRESVSEVGPAIQTAAGTPSAVDHTPASMSAARLEELHCLFRAVNDPPSMPRARKLISFIRLGEGDREEVYREELYDLEADPGELRNLLVPGAPPEERAAAERLRVIGRVGR
jgi:arylsulfatase A-like enzyme